ncbi:hypothetical protein ACIQNT_38835 [Streptomyces luteogriseus]|uniref:hypothetical protein n=1 Tax=Streptomyces luteogriseus TaxID=68233 RepID=UPI00382C68C6
MNPENSAIPAPREDDPLLSAGMKIAMQWGHVLDADKLKVALEALEPQLKREHQLRVKQLDLQARRQDAEERKEKRRHALQMTGLVAGAVVGVAMLAAGVYTVKDAWWLGVLLCGPVFVAALKIFVLRRSDKSDVDAVLSAMKLGMREAGQSQQPPPPPPPVV